MRSDSSCLTLNPPTMSLWPSLQPAESVTLSHGPQGAYTRIGRATPAACHTQCALAEPTRVQGRVSCMCEVECCRRFLPQIIVGNCLNRMFGMFGNIWYA